MKKSIPKVKVSEKENSDQSIVPQSRRKKEAVKKNTDQSNVFSQRKSERVQNKENSKKLNEDNTAKSILKEKVNDHSKSEQSVVPVPQSLSESKRKRGANSKETAMIKSIPKVKVNEKGNSNQSIVPQSRRKKEAVKKNTEQSNVISQKSKRPQNEENSRKPNENYPAQSILKEKVNDHGKSNQKVVPVPQSLPESKRKRETTQTAMKKSIPKVKVSEKENSDQSIAQSRRKKEAVKKNTDQSNVFSQRKSERVQNKENSKKLNGDNTAKSILKEKVNDHGKSEQRVVPVPQSVPGSKRKRGADSKHTAMTKKQKQVQFRTEDQRLSQPKRPIRRKLSLSENIKLGAPDKEFVVNEIVLGTVTGYAPWPARIVDITGETIRVEFFGTGEMNPLRSNAVSRFELNRTIPFMERKGYRKAMRELESVLGIPKEFSLFE